MKILLTNPPFEDERLLVRSGSRWPATVPCKKGERHYTNFPFPLAYSSAILKENGFNVKVIDALPEEMKVEEFIAEVDKYKPDMLVMEISTPSINSDIKLAKKLKKYRLVLVGQHASSRPKDVSKFCDHVITGEYEFSLLDLAQGKVKGKIITGRMVDFNDFPMPDRGALNMELYGQSYFPRPNIHMLTSRGCPNRCNFCVEPWIYKSKYGARGIDKVEKEIKQVIAEYKPPAIWFDDSNFCLNKKRVYEFCRMIKKFNIMWGCMTSTTLVDEDMLREMGMSGCKKIVYGLETNSKDSLAAIGKGVNITRFEKMLVASKKVGMNVHVTFMVGLLGDTRKSIRENLNYMKYLGRKGLIDTVQCAIATPFPGTRFYDQVKKKGYLVEKDWRYYDGSYTSVVSYPDLTKEEIEEFYNKFYDVWKYDALNARRILRFAMHPSKDKIAGFFKHKMKGKHGK